MKKWIWIYAFGFGLIPLMHPGDAGTQEISPPVAVAPQRIEISQPTFPIQIPAEEAGKLGGGSTKEEGALLSPLAEPLPPDTQVNKGISQTILVETPEIVNTTPQFHFQDVTDRTLLSPQGLSPAKRRAAVEAYRQSLKRDPRSGR